MVPKIHVIHDRVLLTNVVASAEMLGGMVLVAMKFHLQPATATLVVDGTSYMPIRATFGK